VAKFDLQHSRAAALADDGDEDDLLRPQAKAKPRTERPRSEAQRDRALARDLRPLTLDTAAAGEDDEEDQEFIQRARRRAPVKRGIFPKGRTGRILLACCILTIVGAVIASALGIRSFFEHDPRFRIDGASSIQILGNSQVTRSELLAVFGGDIGRNIFFVPLAERRAELESLPWVKQATVMRLLPDQLHVTVVERKPVAFVRHGNRVGLVDADGVLLDMPPAMMAARRYSFPVVAGIGSADDIEQRAKRMQLYERFVSALDGDGSNAAEQLSEVDLSDPEDVRAVLPSRGSDILVHFGDENFAERYHSFEQHLPGWKRQYPNLAAVDLRYQHQTVLEMAPAPAGNAAATPPKPAATHAQGAQSKADQKKADKRHQPQAKRPSHTTAKGARSVTARG
jgi:cell division protein FtsQ